LCCSLINICRATNFIGIERPAIEAREQGNKARACGGWQTKYRVLDNERSNPQKKFETVVEITAKTTDRSARGDMEQGSQSG